MRTMEPLRTAASLPQPAPKKTLQAFATRPPHWGTNKKAPRLSRRSKSGSWSEHLSDRRRGDPDLGRERHGLRSRAADDRRHPDGRRGSRPRPLDDLLVVVGRFRRRAAPDHLRRGWPTRLVLRSEFRTERRPLGPPLVLFGKRQLERERRTAAAIGLDPDPAAHPAHDLAADVEAQARAADPAREIRVEAIELLEDPLVLGGRDSESPVPDGEAHTPFERLQLELDPAAVGRVLDRVLD